MRIKSLEELKDILSRKNKIAENIKIIEDKLIISKDKDKFLLEIYKNHHLYNVYFNGIFYHGIDGEDIEESLLDFINSVIVIDKDDDDNKKVYILTNKEYEKIMHNLHENKQVSIFTFDFVIKK